MQMRGTNGRATTMGELAAIIISVAGLCTIGALLERQGGGVGALGGLLVMAGGFVAGGIGSLVLGLAVTPGACVAVLCPTCYHDPPAAAVWHAGLVYFTVLGLASGLMPGRRFSVGFGVGCLLVAMVGAEYWGHFGAAATMLPGMAFAVVLWAIRWEVGRRLSGGSGGRGADASTGVPSSTDFWDGQHWGAAPRG